jgi:general secretion pathway protein K
VRVRISIYALDENGREARAVTQARIVLNTEIEVLMRRPRRQERGVALLLVTVSIAILTAVAAEFAFQTRVDLELATHQRDALRAEYLAKSSIGLARMLLLFQKQLDRSTAALPGAAQGINLQLWRMAKLDCHLLQSVVPQAGQGRRPKFSTAGGGGLDEQGRIQYGGFAGCFDARIEDEQEKLNVNALAGLQTGTAQGAVQRLYNLVSDRRFDFIFDREDANRIRANPNDVLIGLRIGWTTTTRSPRST